MSSVDAHHAAIAVTDTTDAPGARGSVDAYHAAAERHGPRSRQEAWMVTQRDLLEEAHRGCTSFA